MAKYLSLPTIFTLALFIISFSYIPGTEARQHIGATGRGTISGRVRDY